MAALVLGTSKRLTKVSLYMLLITLLTTRTLYSLLFLKLNIFWTANNSGPRSIFWSSIKQVKKELHNNAIFQLHASNTSIWSAPWCPVWETTHDHLLLPVTVSPLPSTASDLWIPNTHDWNMHLLSNTFDNHVIQVISSTRPVPSVQNDILRWENLQYRCLYHQGDLQVSFSGKHYPTPTPRFQDHPSPCQSNPMACMDKQDLPPLIKTFTWRLIHRALATADRAARYSTHIDNKHCDACGAIENDVHLFFHCNLPRAVWFSFSPPMRTDNLLLESDGIQSTLHSFISNSTSDTIFNKILYTLWYIWKARNDYHFNRKHSTQVHHATVAHMSSYNAALIPQVGPNDNSTEETTPATNTDIPPMPPHHHQTTHQGMPTALAGSPPTDLLPCHPTATSDQPRAHSSSFPGTIPLMQQQQPTINRFRITAPALLQGNRCYVNASITPDQPNQLPRTAGLGIFILHLQEQST